MFIYGLITRLFAVFSYYNKSWVAAHFFLRLASKEEELKKILVIFQVLLGCSDTGCFLTYFQLSVVCFLIIFISTWLKKQLKKAPH